jgi:hypothetical protein
MSEELHSKLPVTMADVWSEMPLTTKQRILNFLISRGKVPPSSSIGSVALMRISDVLTLMAMPQQYTPDAAGVQQAAVQSNGGSYGGGGGGGAGGHGGYTVMNGGRGLSGLVGGRSGGGRYGP